MEETVEQLKAKIQELEAENQELKQSLNDTDIRAKELLEALSEIHYIAKWNGNERQDPYKFGDWFRFLTPIERNVWNDIRYLGLPFYPQFPVGKYYIDFADPHKKIALEIDGRVHDDEDVAAKDNTKQQFLESLGWRVIRIAGYKTYRARRNFENDDEEIDQRYWTQSAEGILELLKEEVYRFDYASDNEVKLISSHEVLASLKDIDHGERIEKNKKLFAK